MRPFTSTLRFSGIRLSSSVSRNSDSISSSGSTARDFGSITTRMSSADSSRTSPTSGSFFSLSSSAIFSISRDFCTSHGNFGDDDDPGAARALLLAPFGAGAERAAPGHIGFRDALLGIDDDAAGREIRTLDEAQQRFRLRVRLVDQVQRRLAEFGGVVRRDRGRHADRDALRAVGEQVRKAAGQHDRLFRLAVVVGAEFDAVLVDAVEQQPRDLGHARFGVAVGGGIIAVDVAEIALPVDQRIARGEILRQPHQRVVDRLVAVRMERAHHVADDFGGFLERRAGIEPQQPHAVEDAAMHRLQPVARIRQRAVHDGRERVGEIALFQRLAQLTSWISAGSGGISRFPMGRG